jgi:hypothetical protein
MQELIGSPAFPRDRLKMLKLYQRDGKVLGSNNQLRQTAKY